MTLSFVTPTTERRPTPLKLGVGLLYNPALPEFLRAHLDAVDYVEIIPDMGQTDHGPDHTPRYVEIEDWETFLEWLVHRRPVVAHHIGLSIGSADHFDPDYVRRMDQWHQRYPFAWCSDHLSFSQVTSDHGRSYSVGLALPIPYDGDLLERIEGRVRHLQGVLPSAFLLENNVYFFDIPDQEMTEPEFLNRLTDRTGCGLLLDIHNLYANARNHGFDPYAFLAQLDLTRVIEIHIAGGNEVGGMYADSHSGPCPEPVWELLRYVVPNTPHLCGITFEFHESYYPHLGAEGIIAQLAQARAIWSRSF
jgi:uncharacterized protein (UPF0276 family)